jgi:predicted MFS family arabinose efflux permease
MDFMIIMPLGEMLMEELSIGSQEFSFLVASYTIMAGITGLISAFFVDSFDRKKYFLVAYLGFAIGTFLCGFADTYTGLITARIITGAFGGVISSTVIAIVSDVIASERRAWGLGIVMTAFSMASALGLPVGLYFAFNFGWNWPFVALGTLSLVNAIAVYFTLPPVREHLDNPEPGIDSLEFIRNIPKNKNQWMALTYTMLLMFGHFAVIPFITPYLVENVGFERDQITFVYLVGGIATIISNPRVGRWADRSGRAKVFNIMAFSSIVPIVLLTNLPVVPVWVALIVTGLLFVLIGGRMVSSTAIVASVIKPRNRGSFMSLNSSVQNMTTGLASIVAGILVTIPKGGHHVFGFWKVGILGALFTLIAIWMMSKITKISTQKNDQL